MADDGVASRHALHADRQHRRDHRGQALRHRRDGERHPEDQHVEDRGEPAHVLDQQDRRNHHRRDGDDRDREDLAHPVELLLQGGSLLGPLLQEAGDVPHLGLHARRGDDRKPVPVGRRRAAEDHVVTIAEARVRRDRRDVLRHRQALAGQRRLRRLQRRHLDQAAVGGNCVALLDHQDVARHEIRRRHALPLAAANHLRLRRGHLAERRHRLFRARLLQVAHHSVEQHDREDRDGLVRQRRVALGGPEARRNQAGAISRITSTSENWARNFRQAGTGASAVSSFLP